MRLLVEHGANIVAKSDLGVTPRRLLRDRPEEFLSLKRRRSAVSSPDCACPGAVTRLKKEEGEEDDEPLIDVDKATMLAQNDSYAYVVCQRASGCNKRVRRSERESSQGPCAPPCKSAVVPYQDLEPEAAGGLVNVPLKASQARMERIDRMTSGFDPSSFTLPAVCKETKTIAGYFMPPLILTKTTLKLETCHCKVDRAHKGRGLGGLLCPTAPQFHSGLRVPCLQQHPGRSPCALKSKSLDCKAAPSPPAQALRRKRRSPFRQSCFGSDSH